MFDVHCEVRHIYCYHASGLVSKSIPLEATYFWKGIDIMTHKEKCKQMKSIRKTIADKIGIDLHQTECTYKGDCKGTCPRCEQEEKILNKALLKNTAAVAGLAMSAISITGCGSIADRTTESRINTAAATENNTENNTTTLTTSEDIAGGIAIEGLETDPNCTVTLTTTENQLTGDEYIPTTGDLEGDTTSDTTEDLIELDGDVAMPIVEDELDGVAQFSYSDEEIISACQKYSKADVAFIKDYNGDIATVDCYLFLNELDPETGESKKEPIAQISVDSTTGEATCNTGANFNISDYLSNE